MDTGFEAFGRTYRSEGAAVVSFLDKARAGEANGAEAFAAWAAVCRTDALRTGLAMIAEREAYHARILERRLVELGGERRAGTTEEGRKLRDLLGDPEASDAEKLLYFTRFVGSPEEAVRPIRELEARLREDLDTKEALRLFAEWICEQCVALGSATQAASLSPRSPDA